MSDVELGAIKKGRRLREQSEEIQPEINGINHTEEILAMLRIPNWKAPRRNGVPGYWIKKLSPFHKRTASQLNEILSDGKRLPEWRTYWRTVLCQEKKLLKEKD